MKEFATSAAHESPEHETDDYIVWHTALRTVFTKADIAEIVAAIKAASEPILAAQNASAIGSPQSTT